VDKTENQSLEIRIWDTFLYSGEKELLKLRLQSLDTLVDFFVVVESAYTFSGNFRVLSNPEFRRDLKKEYPNKIHWIILDKSNPEFTAWQRESWQRNQINQGMEIAKETDIVMLSDVDEIPNPNFVNGIRGLRKNEIRIAQMELYFYEYDFKSERNWFGTIATRWDKEIDFQVLRMRGVQSWSLDSLEIIELAGAHMSSIGSSKNLVSKIRSFSHTELNVFPFNNRTFLGTLILLGICFDGSEVLKLNRSSSLVNGLNCHKKHRFDCLRVRFARILTPFVCRLYKRRIGSLSAPI
jgi:beta-1,4-mannosyl-glycoprotein beta-1,4-N-acetylglucosaminyltransferase